VPRERREDPHELALRALSYKERTESELDAWLAARGVEKPERIDVLLRLQEAGALDDERFAARYAEDKRELSGWGPERIRRALKSRGVADECVDAALAGDGLERQTDRAVALLGERGMRCDSAPERERALRLLVRRGYALELAYEAVRVAEGLADAA
jgi:regulatory protein